MVMGLGSPLFQTKMAGSMDYQKFGVTKLSHDNYHTWKEKAKFLLAREGLWSYVTNPPPATTDSKWVEKNEIALATIGLLLSDQYITDIRGLTTAHEAWKTLKTLHEKSSIGSRLILYKRIFNSKHTVGHSVHEYIQGITETANRLEDAGHPVDQELLGGLLLSGLPKEFDPLVTSLEGRKEETLSLGYLREKIVEEDSKLHKRHEEARPNTKALYVQENQHPGTRNRNPECFYCHKTGHIRKDCRLLAKHTAHENLDQPRRYPSYEPKPQLAPLEHGKYTARTSPMNMSDPLFGEDSRQETASYKRPLTANEGRQRAMTVSMNTENSQDVTWVVDSGSFAHLCCDKSLLQTYKDLDNPVHITAASGNHLRAVGEGTAIIRLESQNQKVQEFGLSNVLYVPNLSENLISTSKLSTDGITIFFGQGKVWANTETEKYQLGQLEENLYIHKEKRAQPTERACLCLHAWHALLGHRNYQDIKDMHSQNLTQDLTISPCNCDNLCETCEISKKTNKKFHSREKQDINLPFLMVHTDLCGPITPTTIGGNKYVLSLIDDYTHYTKVYMISHKSQVTDCVVDYIEKGSNKFGYRPLILRSDNGGEFVNHHLDRYLSTMGIEHQTTIAYTPQENGTSERRNRSLMETTRSLLHQGRLPRYLWGEVASTANYLLNLSKSQTRPKTPYEMWHQQKPTYGHLKLIGSSCYYLINKPLKGKLSDRGEKGTLVGYGPSKSFFRIWNPHKREIVLSRTVTFTLTIPSKTDTQNPPDKEHDTYLE